MGFCLFNNIAIAARRLLEPRPTSASPSSTGTCTTATARRPPSSTIRACSSVSLHQWPLYPGSGWFNECGVGDGEGYTVNIPLAVGEPRRRLRARLRRVVEPIVDSYRASGGARLGRTGPARRRPAGQHVAHRGRLRASWPVACRELAAARTATGVWRWRSRAATTARRRRTPWRPTCARFSTKRRPTVVGEIRRAAAAIEQAKSVQRRLLGGLKRVRRAPTRRRARVVRGRSRRRRFQYSTSSAVTRPEKMRFT